VLDAVQRATGLSPNKARALLGRFLFSGELADVPLDALSGGERRRLSLAILVSAGANVLILDEPTNHLDLESREALEDALLQFPGSLLLVSHDRALLDAVGTRTVAVEDRTLRSYLARWPEYARAREERGPAPAAPPPPPAGAGGDGRREKSPRAKPAGPSKQRLRRQEQLEDEVERAEAALRALEEELSDPDAWATKYEAAKSEARHTAARRAVENAYAELEQFVESAPD
jgi:ATP-binding cassette subfamily F protein 3